MNNEKLGQEPAFACMYGTSENGYLQEGMSKRFYAACMAMQGLLANDGLMELTCNEAKNKKVHDSVLYAKMAYEYADELLSQENM